MLKAFFYNFIMVKKQICQVGSSLHMDTIENIKHSVIVYTGVFVKKNMKNLFLAD